jgi:hypothetical protein
MGLPRYHEMPWRTNAKHIDPGQFHLDLSQQPVGAAMGNQLFHYCLNDLVDGTGMTTSGQIGGRRGRPALFICLIPGMSPALAHGLTSTPICTIVARSLFSSMATPRGSKTRSIGISKHNKGITNNPALVWIP